MPIITLFFKSNGLSIGDILLLQAIFSITVLVSEVPTGYVADRLGHKRSIVLGAVFASAGGIMYMLATGFWTIMIAEILLGFSIAFISGADSALLYNTLIALKQTDKHKRVESRMVSMQGVSEGVASILGGLLAAAVALRAPFVVEAVVFTLTIPIALALYEPLVRADSAKSIEHVSHIQEVRRILTLVLHRHKRLKWILLYAAAVSTSTLVMVWFTQPYWELVQVPLVWFGVLWAMFNFAVAYFATWAEKFEQALGLRRALVALVLLIFSAYIVLGLYPSVMLLPVFLVFYFVRAVQRPIIRDYVHKNISSDIRATVLSVQSLLGRILFVALGPVLGYAADVYSLPQALIFSGIIFLLLGGVSTLFLKRHKV
jgi:MFS family permease